MWVQAGKGLPQGAQDLMGVAAESVRLPLNRRGAAKLFVLGLQLPDVAQSLVRPARPQDCFPDDGGRGGRGQSSPSRPHPGRPPRMSAVPPSSEEWSSFHGGTSLGLGLLLTRADRTTTTEAAGLT